MNQYKPNIIWKTSTFELYPLSWGIHNMAGIEGVFKVENNLSNMLAFKHFSSKSKTIDVGTPSTISSNIKPI